MLPLSLSHIPLLSYSQLLPLLFFIYNSQKLEVAQMSISNEWINILRYIHTMDYYSIIKRNEISKE